MKSINQTRRPVSAKPATKREKNTKNFLDLDSVSPLKTQKNLQNEYEIVNKLLGQYDPLEARKEKYKIQLKKHKQLLAKVSFFDPDIPPQERKYQYSYEKLMPYVFFFKYLAKKPNGPEEKQKNTINRLKIWLPDTLVFNDGDLPAMWFYTSQSGFVYRADSFNKRNIVQKFGEHCSPDELVCVLKKPCYRNQELVGNDVNIVSKSELDTVSSNLFQDKNQLTVLQRFVKSNGPKAFICRTIWRKDKNPYAWIVTNKLDYKDKSDAPEIKKYIINMQIMNSCTIVESQKGKFVEETVPQLDNIGRYFHIHLGITFKEIIGDFIKDESGLWWLINIRGFLLDKYEIPINVKPITEYGEHTTEIKRSPFADIAKQKETYQRVQPCKYCEEIFPTHELTNKLTLKMILQTDKHLQNRGKQYEWLNRTDLKHIDTPMLYQEHKVCSSCFKLYIEIDKLITAEFNFAKIIGIPVTEDTKINLTSATQLNGFYGTFNNPNQSKINNFIDNPGDKQMPQNWEFNIEPETEIIVKNNFPSNESDNDLNKLCKYRFMVLINSVRDIPIQKEVERNYYLEYSFLDIKEKYKIEMQHAVQSGDDYSNFHVPLNRMRIFYFFVTSRKQLNQFINQNQFLQINLLCENKIIGNTQLELNEFTSDQVIRNEYFKVFNGKDLPLLKWSVTVTLGLVASQEIDVKRIGLREYQGIYLPNSLYYTCEPLPQEWIQYINSKPDWEKQPSVVLTKSVLASNKENPNCSYLSKTNRSGFYDIKAESPYKNSKDNSYFSNKQNRLFSASPRKSKQSDEINISELLDQSNNNNNVSYGANPLQNNITNSLPYGKKIKLIQQNNNKNKRNMRFSQNIFNQTLADILNEEEQNLRKKSQSFSKQNEYKKGKSQHQNNSSNVFYNINENEKSPINSKSKQNNQNILNNLLQSEIFSYSKDYGLTDSYKKLPIKKMIYWK
ncbi:hypothetical protein ABPG73_003404 [Tetrahymena malaccensis]